MNLKKLILLAAMLAAPHFCKAQIYSYGDDPGRLKWKSVSSADYRVIYPEGLDSLAFSYARNLQAYNKAVGLSSHFRPNANHSRPHDVVLHAYGAYSNGMVMWAPRRMDLFTCPDAYDPTNLDWISNLTIHENRHVSQFNAFEQGFFRPARWIIGDLATLAGDYLFLGMHTIEGDAVIAETALTSVGRGRSADFLNYYMIAFDKGDWRSWNRWRCGSQKYYAPNYYALGYMLYSGARYFYDDAEILGKTYEGLSKSPLRFRRNDHIYKDLVGCSPGKSFMGIAEKTYGMWHEEMLARGPFMEGDLLTSGHRRYTTFSGSTAVGDSLFSVRSGLIHVPEIVSVGKNGEEKHVRYINSTSGKLASAQGGNKIYWSETVWNGRWSLESESRLRCYDTTVGKTSTIPGNGRYFNPSVSSDGKLLAVSEYPVKGGSALVVIDSESGTLRRHLAAPDSLQIVESAWVGERVFASALSHGGFGVYEASTEGWKQLLETIPCKIKSFGSRDGKLLFTCDYDGTDELFELNPEDGRLFQLSSTRYGANAFVFSEDGKRVSFSLEEYEGKLIHSIVSDSLVRKEVSPSGYHHYAIADALSRQEESLGYKPSEVWPDTVALSEAKRFGKLANMVRIHSWTPFYVSIDKAMAMNFDKFYDVLAPGIAAMSQNSLGTASASFGYSAHPDYGNLTGWRHTGHLSVKYTGLYPVFKASVDFNDRAANNYTLATYHKDGEMVDAGVLGAHSQRPYFYANLAVNIPWHFNSGGWLRGLTPELSWSFSNDSYNISPARYNAVDNSSDERFAFAGGEKNLKYSQAIMAAIRGYSMLAVTPSCVYPRFGGGFELGTLIRPGLGGMIAPMAYAYGYAYLPGFVRQQGLKLSALAQTRLDAEAFFTNGVVKTLPRGLEQNGDLYRYLLTESSANVKLTADYAIPIYMGDISIADGLAYIKRLVITPHADFSFFGKGKLYSVGSSFALDLTRIVWIDVPASVGVSVSYNGGSLYGRAAAEGIQMRRVFVGPVFNLSLP